MASTTSSIQQDQNGFNNLEWYILTNKRLVFLYAGKNPPKKIRYSHNSFPKENGRKKVNFTNLGLYLLEINRFENLSKEDQLTLGKEKNYYGWHTRKAYEELNSTKNKKRRDSLIQRIHYLTDKMMEPVNELLLHNLRYVVNVANRYNKVRTSLEDKIQYGTIGLYEAIFKFNHNRDNTLITYAKRWIIQAIQRGKESAIYPKSVYPYLITIPTDIISKTATLKRWEFEFMSKNGKMPTEKEIQKKMKDLDLSKRRYYDARSVIDVNSLDGLKEEKGYWDLPNGGDQNKDKLLDYMDKELIRKEVKRLKPREQKIIKLRFGLDNGIPFSLEEVGKEFKLSRERIRQIEEKALKRLSKRQFIRSLRADLAI